MTGEAIATDQQSTTYTVVLVAIFIIIGILLLYYEYINHDAINGKQPLQSVPKPEPDDPNNVRLKKIRAMVKNNIDYTIWRQAFFVGLVAALPVIYFIKDRMPTAKEWFVTTLLIFAGAYLSYSWIWTHFFEPNATAINEELKKLEEKLAT